MTADHEITVLVTGFGEFLDIKTNPSWEIVKILPSTIEDPSLPCPIRIITQPVPLHAAYHSLLTTVQPLLEKYEPDFVIHVGLAADRDYFAIEKGAERDGYHQIPDEDRKVITRAEGKKLWGKSPARLDSAIDIDAVLVKWQQNAKIASGKTRVKGKGKGAGKDWDLRTSDDAGTYVCGFVYYVSLEWLWKTKKAANVLFFHVPNLEGKEEFEKGKDITLSLIKAVAESL